MKVCLVTEGTYPVHPGGVGDWCSRLIRGLPEVEFSVVALTGSGREPARYPAPANLVRTERVGMWAAPPRVRRARPADHRFVAAFARLVESVLRDGPITWFADAVRALRELARVTELSTALRSQAAVDLVVDVARRVPGPEPTLADALAVTDLMEHFLRPLQLPAPRADVVHATANGPGTLLGLLAKWEHGTPLVLSEHGVYLRERLLATRREAPSRVARAALGAFYARLTELGYRGADEVLPVSCFNARWARRGGAEAVRVLPNGVEPLPVMESEPEVPTLAFAGRIDPLKDLHMLLRAFAIVRERVPEARLRLFGGVPEGNEAYAASCRALAAELGLAEAVGFEGPVRPVTEAFAAGHVVVLSSLSEGLPLTIIEAAMSGRATVATDVGGIAEAVGPGGIVVPAGDAAAFAEACVALLTDPARRAGLAAAGRAHAMAHFNLDDLLRSVRKVYTRHTTAVPEPRAPEPEATEPAPVRPVAQLVRRAGDGHAEAR